MAALAAPPAVTGPDGAASGCNGSHVGYRSMEILVEMTALMARGAALTPEDADALLRSRATGFAERERRSLLATYFSAVSIREMSPSAELSQHLLWLVRTHPESPEARRLSACVDRDSNLELHDALGAAWHEAIQKQPTNPEVVGGAGLFLRSLDPKAASRCLRESVALNAQLPEFTHALGKMCLTEYLFCTSASADESRRALELAASHSAPPSLDLVHDSVLASYHCGRFFECSRYAERLIGLAVQHPNKWLANDHVHFGSTVLGLVALAQGDSASARKYLVNSIPSGTGIWLRSRGPSFVLAARLASQGDAREVATFLLSATGVWPDGLRTLASLQNSLENSEAPQWPTRDLWMLTRQV